jgi:hypothetical protein
VRRLREGLIGMINPRQKQILELAERRGYVSIDALAALFDMTPQRGSGPVSSFDPPSAWPE